VIVAIPAAAVDAAVSVTFLAVPGISVRVDGLAVTPVGRPLRVTFTLAVNPFRAFALTATAWPAAPAVNARLVGATVSEKSGAGVAAVTLNATVAM
jgi:hypothetical protein